eukprot:g9232.t1
MGRKIWACAAAAAATASITVAYAEQASPAGGAANDAKLAYDASERDMTVHLKPDLKATSFSPQNGYFFANMSELAYKSPEEVESTLAEMEDCKGLQDNFQWFQSGPGKGETILENVRDFIQDTECFVAANDDVLLLVFRGTSERMDWLTNLRGAPRAVTWCPKEERCSIHRGFDDAVSLMWEPIHEKIKELHGDGKGRKLYIAGHSLGGALATVAAARLAFEDNMNIAGVYTIGSPRLFDADLARNFDARLNDGIPMKDKVFRARNNNDAVTRLPPVPYEHIGTEIYFDRFGTISTSSFTDRILGRLSAFVRLSIVDGISDHDAEAYITLFKNAIVSSRLSLLDKTKSVMKDAAQKVMPTSGPEKTGDEL